MMNDDVGYLAGKMQDLTEELGKVRWLMEDADSPLLKLLRQIAGKDLSIDTSQIEGHLSHIAAEVDHISEDVEKLVGANKAEAQKPDA